MNSRRHGILIFLFSVCLATLSFMVQAQNPTAGMRFSLPTGILDLPRCLAQPGNRPVPLTPTNSNLEIIDWNAAPQPTNHVAEFVLRPKNPVPVGCLVAYEPGSVSLAVNGTWQELAPGPGAEAGRKLQVLAFPPTARVEAIQFKVPAKPLAAEGTNPASYRATLPFATLLPIPAVNIAAAATVTASSVETGGPPPQTLVDGVIDPVRNFSTASRTSPVSGAAPEWLLLTWDKPRALRGFGIFRGSSDAGLGDLRIETFSGAGEPSRSADSAGWQELRTRNTAQGLFRAARFYVASAPVETRGLRWMTTGGVSQVQLGEIAVFSLVTNTDLVSRPPSRSWTVPRVSPDRIRVDGRDADWPAGRTNGFALAWDEQRLYLLYHATGAEATFENRGTNARELFHTGDALDLQLQTRSGPAADRTNPAPGDLRLIFSMFEGKPLCVLYEYHADDLLLLPVTFKGADGSVSCDKVGPIPDAVIEVRRADRELMIEASVPLKAIGWAPGALAETRGDVGRIFGVPTGADRGVSRRRYWSNPATNAPGDIASGAGVQPRLWGTMRFAKDF